LFSENCIIYFLLDQQNRSIHQLAGKSDITDYARMRRAQMARDERDR
jgi:hypothetical protein